MLSGCTFVVSTMFTMVSLVVLNSVRSRRSKSSFCFEPKRLSYPSSRLRMFNFSYSRRAISQAVRLATSRVNGSTATYLTPASNNNRRCSSGSSSQYSFCRRPSTKEGCAVSVTTRFTPFSNSRCPRWTPSNTPMVTAVGSGMEAMGPCMSYSSNIYRSLMDGKTFRMHPMENWFLAECTLPSFPVASK